MAVQYLLDHCFARWATCWILALCTSTPMKFVKHVCCCQLMMRWVHQSICNDENSSPLPCPVSFGWWLDSQLSSESLVWGQDCLLFVFAPSCKLSCSLLEETINTPMGALALIWLPDSKSWSGPCGNLLKDIIIVSIFLWLRIVIVMGLVNGGVRPTVTWFQLRSLWVVSLELWVHIDQIAFLSLQISRGAVPQWSGTNPISIDLIYTGDRKATGIAACLIFSLLILM